MGGGGGPRRPRAARRPPSPAARAALGRVPSSSILPYWQHSPGIDSPPPKLRKRTNERSVTSLRKQSIDNRGRIFYARVTSPNCTVALPALCHFFDFAITPRRWGLQALCHSRDFVIWRSFAPLGRQPVLALRFALPHPEHHAHNEEGRISEQGGAGGCGDSHPIAHPIFRWAIGSNSTTKLDAPPRIASPTRASGYIPRLV
jgi:hypothetical protein